MQLHRVVFDDVGYPLWKYKSPEQLVRAIRMALVAHRDLCFLWMDISAGNILTCLIPGSEGLGGTFEERKMDVEKMEGFMTDFEIAEPPRLESETPETAPGDEMTGTVAFMASSLLQDIRNAKPGEAVARTAEQDIESFAWVFVFAVYKHALEYPKVALTQTEAKALRKEFNRVFPGRSATSESVLTARYIMRLPQSNQHILQHIQTYYVENPDLFCELFDWVWTVLADRLPVKRRPMNDEVIVHALKLSPTLLALMQPPRSLPPLTHNIVLSLFDACLELIEEAKSK